MIKIINLILTSKFVIRNWKFKPVPLEKPLYINITALTVVKIILVMLLFYFLYLIQEILAVLFISLIFASAVDPWIDWMQKRKIPRGIGIFLIYLVMFSFVGTAVYLIVPPIVKELNDLMSNFPKIFEKMSVSLSALKDYSSSHGLIDSFKENISSLSNNLQGAAGSIFSLVGGVFGSVVTFILVMVITFYMVVEENAMKKLVWSLVPAKNQTYVMGLINRMQKKIGLWLRGQLILSFVIFLLTYIGLSILGVKYALVLALIAGITESVPYLGPILASIPAIFLAFTQSPMLALLTGILYYVIQVTENNIIVPKIMEKVVGLNPIVSIAVLMIGFKLAGVIGAILSIPVATAVSVFIEDLFNIKAVNEAAQNDGE